MITFMQSKMNSRGQITIPIELRRKLGITAGTRFIVREVDGQIEVMTMRQYAHSLRGKYKGMGLMRALKEDRKLDTE